MIRTVFAMAAAALLFAAVSGTSQAAPIAPLTGVTASRRRPRDAGVLASPSPLLARTLGPRAIAGNACGLLTQA